MNIKQLLINFAKRDPFNRKSLEFLRYLGPGILVTVGFIDPGNWAANVAAGAQFGYSLLWMVTLSTIMLILLQHNAAHLGIATGLCISEAATAHLRPWVSRTVLGSGMIAVIATALAELLGGAIALYMLFKIPIKLAAVLIMLMVAVLLFTNSYRKLEAWIIGFVSIIGFSFVFELSLMKIEWETAAVSWVVPSFPEGSIPIIMSVLGAVVMPHNLFLHSEIIQSRQWHLEDDAVIKRQMNYEFLDTLFSMLIGWGINSAMILVAAATFFANKVEVTELQQAMEMLRPMVGPAAAIVFALALLFAGIASSITASMAGGTIFAGIFGEHYDIRDKHSIVGVTITLVGALIVIMFISDPFKALIYSQVLLSIQLPITIFLQISLTSSKKVMGQHVNTTLDSVLLWIIGGIVTILNIRLLLTLLFGI